MRCKLLYAFLLFLLTHLPSLTARAQAPAWQSAVVLGASSSLRPTRVVPDAAGNLLLTGTFFGTVQLGATSLTSAGFADAFVAKWNPATSSFAWAVRLGGADGDYADALAVVGSSVYVAGNFFSISFQAGASTLTNANPNAATSSSDLFVVKLSDAGTAASVSWAVRAGGPLFEQANALAVVGNAVYVAGAYSDPFTLGSTPLTSAGNDDVFVAKLADSGSTPSWSWAVSGGGTNRDDVSQLVAGASGVVYAAGLFQATARFGPAGPQITSAGADDVWVARLTDAGSSGSWDWVRRGGSVVVDYLRGLAVVGTTLYVGGEFNGATADFGATQLANAGSTAAGTTTDCFLARLTDAGPTTTWSWALRLGTAATDQLGQLAARGSRLYVGGSFGGTSLTLGATTLANSGPAGTSDLFLARLTDAGSTASFDWAQQAGGPGSDAQYQLALGATTVYACGSSVLPATFGSLALTGTGSTSSVYLASLADATGLAVRPAALPTALLIYPNPARAATVAVPAGSGPATVVVLDALGRVVQQHTASAGQPYTLSLAGVAPGLYTVQVRVAGSIALGRLVVE